ncbi:MAG TPA: MarR family EPS-associated transcriptional regulator [Steroidobacteraceae bacterium]
MLPAQVIRNIMLADEVTYKLMRLLQAYPSMSQRDAARELGVSLGKVNCCVRALVSKGWVKTGRFKNSHNKAAYRYLLTSRGAQVKARLTQEFLRVKMAAYEQLRAEIKTIRQDIGHGG